MKRLFLADYVYTGGAFRSDTAIFVDGSVIKEIGSRNEMCVKYPGTDKVDWTGKAIVPGTVNVHNHSFQSLLRGIAVDRPFLEWRDQALYKYAPLLDEEAVYTGALLAFGEMMRCGVTTVCDFFYVHNGGTAHDEAVIRAARDLGIRLVFARTMYDWTGAPSVFRETVEEAVARTRSMAIKYQGNPMVAVHPAPHSPHAASSEMIIAGHKLALELDTPFHIHVAEELFEVEETLRDYGLRPVHYLDSLGVLDQRMIAVHLVWLDDSEIELLGKRRCSLAYCPSSNMFLADGVTRIPDLQNSGVTIALGTDGGCSNNRMSVYEEMRMCSLLQKVKRLDGACITAGQVYEMGTKGGGLLLRLPVGSIEVGNHADFNALNLNDLSLAPSNELFANMVYAMQPGAVSHVVIAGRIVVDKGRIATVPERHIIEKVDRLMESWGKV
ncbi:amidohydrolase family protein [Paenibacillus tarimensis]